MNLHEYQAKQLFAQYGLPVSEGYAVDTADEAVAAAEKIGGDRWVCKVQVHAGGRGKAGGVKLADTLDEVRAFADNWVGKRLVTIQTDADGQPVSKIYVESCTDIANELYLGAVIDRATRRVVFMASTEGGVEIEKVAEETPEKILRATIDPLVGAQPFQGRELAFRLGLARCHRPANESARSMYRASSMMRRDLPGRCQIRWIDLPFQQEWQRRR